MMGAESMRRSASSGKSPKSNGSIRHAAFGARGYAKEATTAIVEVVTEYDLKAFDHPLYADPRPPASLLLISTATTGPDPVVNFGTGLPGETAVSAVIYAPNAVCSASGHVDVYGTLICKSVTAPAGLDVHYDSQLSSFGNSTFDRSVTVSHWHEITN